MFTGQEEHKVDSVVVDMLGLDPNDESVQDMFEHYRLSFARDHNAKGRQKTILKAI